MFEDYDRDMNRVAERFAERFRAMPIGKQLSARLNPAPTPSLTRTRSYGR